MYDIIMNDNMLFNLLKKHENEPGTILKVIKQTLFFNIEDINILIKIQNVLHSHLLIYKNNNDIYNPHFLSISIALENMLGKLIKNKHNIIFIKHIIYILDIINEIDFNIIKLTPNLLQMLLTYGNFYLEIIFFVSKIIPNYKSSTLIDEFIKFFQKVKTIKIYGSKHNQMIAIINFLSNLSKNEIFVKQKLQYFLGNYIFILDKTYTYMRNINIIKKELFLKNFFFLSKNIVIYNNIKTIKTILNKLMDIIEYYIDNFIFVMDINTSEIILQYILIIEIKKKSILIKIKNLIKNLSNNNNNYRKIIFLLSKIYNKNK